MLSSSTCFHVNLKTWMLMKVFLKHDELFIAELVHNLEICKK